MTNSDSILLKAEDLSFSYDKAVLDHISFELKGGRIYALVGPSGAGKTTLLKILAGFLPLKGGSLSYSEALQLHDGSIGVLFQNLALFPWQSVEMHTKMPQILRRAEDPKAREELLEELGLKALRNQYPASLSGGEKQRTALLRVLTTSPKLLLMDEPTAALDKITKESIQDVIFKEQQKFGFTLFVVTHDLEEALFFAEEIMILGNELTSRSNPFQGDRSRQGSEAYYRALQELKSALGGAL